VKSYGRRSKYTNTVTQRYCIYAKRCTVVMDGKLTRKPTVCRRCLRCMKSDESKDFLTSSAPVVLCKPNVDTRQ